jgi:SET domain-containing protein
MTATTTIIDDFLIVKDSGIHGKGVFARKYISSGKRLIKYEGEKVSHKEGVKRCKKSMRKARKNYAYGGVYIFELDDNYSIDGDVPKNHAKYINHSCDPNCDVDIEGEDIWIYSKRDIKEGEELFFEYGFDMEGEYFNFKDNPCRCGAKKCPGYIVSCEDWTKLKKRIEQEKRESKTNI